MHHGNKPLAGDGRTAERFVLARQLDQIRNGPQRGIDVIQKF
jgi:hypothetical protein